MDNTSTGLRTQDRIEAAQWKKELRNLTVAVSELPKLLQVRAQAEKQQRKRQPGTTAGSSPAASVEASDRAVAACLERAQGCVAALPEACLYRPLVDTVSFLARTAGGAGPGAMTELRTQISALNKLALTDQRALKRAVEFMDLRVQAGRCRPVPSLHTPPFPRTPRLPTPLLLAHMHARNTSGPVATLPFTGHSPFYG